MILYLDTSSLVKLYVSEDGSADVLDLVARSELVATSVLAYPEARSAFARLRRENLVGSAEVRRLVAAFEADWPHYLAIDVGEAVCRHAGDLAERHGLRAYDSIHLASFLVLSEAEVGAPLRFSSFDARLNAAARRESAAIAGRSRRT